MATPVAHKDMLVPPRLCHSCAEGCRMQDHAMQALLQHANLQLGRHHAMHRVQQCPQEVYAAAPERPFL